MELYFKASILIRTIKVQGHNFIYYYYYYHHHHHHHLFMQGTYIPETNYVPREYDVAAILLFLFMVLISLLAVLNLLYFYICTFRSMCAVPNMAVFCSSLTSWFPRMLLTYFLNVFEIVPVAPIITGITFVFTFHMHCISIVRYYYYYYYHHHYHHNHHLLYAGCLYLYS